MASKIESANNEIKELSKKIADDLSVKNVFYKTEDFIRKIPRINVPKTKWEEFKEGVGNLFLSAWEDTKDVIKEEFIYGLLANEKEFIEQAEKVNTDIDKAIGVNIKETIGSWLQPKRDNESNNLGRDSQLDPETVVGKKSEEISIKRFSTNVDIDNQVTKSNFFDPEVTFPKTVNGISSEQKKRSIRDFLNANIGEMIKSGPNLMTNMYDLYFSIDIPDGEEVDTAFLLLLSPPVFPTGNNGKVSFKPNKVVQSLLEDVYMLSVRNSSIEIPQRVITSTTIPFMGTEVEVPETKWNMNTDCSLSIKMDSNLYLPEIFQSLAGLRNRGEVLESSRLKDNGYKIKAPNGLGRYNTKINLYVVSHSLSGFTDNISNSYANNKSNLIFVFEDIKFTGTSTNISFSNADSKGKDVGIPFIFKNIKTMYKTDAIAALSSNEKGIKYNKEFNSYLKESLTKLGEL